MAGFGAIQRAVAIACCAVALVSPVAAQDRTEAAMITALAAHGCAVRRTDVAAVLAPEGFAAHAVRDVLARWILDGTASLDAHDRLSLPASLCPPAAPVPSPRDAVITAFQAEGCTMTADGEAVTALSTAGIDAARLGTIIGGLYAAGDVTVEGRRATLAPRLCRFDPSARSD